MKRRLIPISALIAGLLVMYAQVLAQGAAQSTGKKSFTGLITDTICGVSPHHMKGMTETECLRMCIEHGADYALAVGDKVYNLKGDKKLLNKLAGKKVTVTGSLIGDTITADSIKAAGTKH